MIMIMHGCSPYAEHAVGFTDASPPKRMITGKTGEQLCLITGKAGAQLCMITGEGGSAAPAVFDLGTAGTAVPRGSSG